MSKILELDAAPDWLTVTTSSQYDTAWLRQLSARFIPGNGEAHSWRFMDYIGTRWHSPDGAGHVAYAEKASGTLGLLMSSGTATFNVGLQVRKRQLKATRVDLAVTCLHDHPTKSVVEMIPDLDVHRHNFSIIQPLGPEGGTLYVGSRLSGKFGRLYDKGAELQTDVPMRVLWRYEVEYKRELAEVCAQQLWQEFSSLQGMRTYVLENVQQFFVQHGIPVPFAADDADRPSLIRYGTKITDTHRTLKWLTEQVRPAVLKAVYRGAADAVIEALGIGVVDGMPTFEAQEIVPTEQLCLFPKLDFDA